MKSKERLPPELVTLYLCYHGGNAPPLEEAAGIRSLNMRYRVTGL